MAVKVPVFSFEKITDANAALSPEMKSTGEVLGLGKNMQEALFKGLVSAGYKVDKEEKGGVLISVNHRDQPEIIDTARDYDPARLTRYVYDVATLFHKFYNTCRVKGEQDSLQQARLALCVCARTVIANVLSLLKISAPEVM